MNYCYHHYFSYTGKVLKGVRAIYEILTDIENCQIGEGLYPCASAALCARARPMVSVVVIPVYKAVAPVDQLFLASPSTLLLSGPFVV
jgi:hypothetical protein